MLSTRLRPAALWWRESLLPSSTSDEPMPGVLRWQLLLLRLHDVVLPLHGPNRMAGGLLKVQIPLLGSREARGVLRPALIRI